MMPDMPMADDARNNIEMTPGQAPAANIRPVKRLGKAITRHPMF